MLIYGWFSLTNSSSKHPLSYAHRKNGKCVHFATRLRFGHRSTAVQQGRSLAILQLLVMQRKGTDFNGKKKNQVCLILAQELSFISEKPSPHPRPKWYPSWLAASDIQREGMHYFLQEGARKIGPGLLIGKQTEGVGGYIYSGTANCSEVRTSWPGSLLLILRGPKSAYGE